MRTQQAIAAYEKQMRARASETARDILEATEVLHSMEAIPYLERIIS